MQSFILVCICICGVLGRVLHVFFGSDDDSDGSIDGARVCVRHGEIKLKYFFTKKNGKFLSINSSSFNVPNQIATKNGK